MRLPRDLSGAELGHPSRAIAEYGGCNGMLAGGSLRKTSDVEVEQDRENDDTRNSEDDILNQKCEVQEPEDQCECGP